MQIPSNVFKTALARGDAQIGQARRESVQRRSGCGRRFRLAADRRRACAEHGADDPRATAGDRAVSVAAGRARAVERSGDRQAGARPRAQTLLVPMVQSADEARAAVAATRYPPHGIRGVGSALARASRWNRVGDYLHRANDEMAVLVQVETRAGSMRSMRLRGSKVWTVCSSGRRISRLISGISAIRDIRMQAAIDGAIRTIKAAGKAPGILSADEAAARRYLEAGRCSSRSVSIRRCWRECGAVGCAVQGDGEAAVKKGDGTY